MKSKYKDALIIIVLTPIVTILLTLGWFQKVMHQPQDIPPPTYPPVESNQPPSSSYVIAGYFPNWCIYDRKFFPKDLDPTKLSHILYAFANLNPDGTVVLGDAWADTDIRFPKENTVDGVVEPWKDNDQDLHGNFKQFAVLKQRHRHLKVSLSIGGYSWSAHFPTVAANPNTRQTFVNSAMQLLVDLGLDGLDIDWEYPKTPEDAYNYVLLLKELREALDHYHRHHAPQSNRFLLSVAMPCGPENYRLLRLGEMNHYVDIFYLMAYDFAGSWDAQTGHQANLFGSPFSVDQAVNHFLHTGVHSKKIVVGMPLYGRGFSNTHNATGAPYNGVPDGTWEKGSFDYKYLPKQGAREYVDQSAGASWSFDENTREFITYDIPNITVAKCDYIKNRNLGGAMFWELSGDARADNPRSLVSAAYSSLGQELNRDENHIAFPLSKYTNIPH